MSDDCNITRIIKRAQQTMFAEAAKRGITQKIIHYDSGQTISVSAIAQYARGDNVMGLAVMNRLSKIIPADLLSLLLVDEELQIVQAPHELDHDTLCDLARDYVDAKVRAHRADSPAGPAICPAMEAPELNAKAASLKAVGA